MNKVRYEQIGVTEESVRRYTVEFYGYFMVMMIITDTGKCSCNCEFQLTSLN